MTTSGTPLKSLRIVLTGQFVHPMYEPAWVQALGTLGHHVLPFPWTPFFGRFGKLFTRAEHRLLVGPDFARFNRALHDFVLQNRPEVLLLFRATHVWPSTVRSLRKKLPDLLVATYNNDDAFSPGAGRLFWRFYRDTVPHAQVHMVYRHHNLEDLRRLGATNVHLVRSYFLPEKDHPVALTEEERRELGCDVIFAGHYEADGRLPYMERVAASDIDFRLFGTGWDPVTESGPLRRFHPVRRLNGDAYAKGICASKIALCFLSTLNRDTYTRRCFEIPAMGTMLLAQRTPDLETLFLPGVEADFFSSPDELMDKIRYYLAHSEIRESVATAGLRKVHEAGHDILSRMRQVESILTLARRQTV